MALRKRIRWDQFLRDMNWSRTTGYRKVKEGVIPKPHKIGAFNFLFEDEAEAALQAATEKQAAYVWKQEAG